MKANQAIGSECLGCNHIGGIYAEIPEGCECDCHNVESYDK